MWNLSTIISCNVPEMEKKNKVLKNSNKLITFLHYIVCFHPQLRIGIVKVLDNEGMA